ncbi:DUF317 domain-containing protein [Streptomyces bobili]|uniref:DUF317 domain-containing protein n=1 Tax=Streptomyces bobili TaxID=67280 RepID=UPI0033BB0CA1
MSHPFENLDPAQTVQVLPRHLAGPGAVDPRTAWAFPYDEGWPFAQTDDGTAAAFSPCLRLQTTYDPQPDQRGKGTWTVSAHRAPFTPPAWRITFDAATPVELLHDVHTELLDLYLEDRHSDHDRLFRDETAPHEVYVPLLTRGWSHDVKTDGTQTFLTPEGLGGLRHRYAISGSSGRPHPQHPLHRHHGTEAASTAAHLSPRHLPPRLPAEPADLPHPLIQGVLPSCTHASFDPSPSPSR